MAQFRAGARLIIAFDKSGLSHKQFAEKLKMFALSSAASVLPESERALIARSPDEFAFSLMIPGGRTPSPQLLSTIAEIFGVSRESLVNDDDEATDRALGALFREKAKEIEVRKKRNESIKFTLLLVAILVAIFYFSS